MMREIKTPALMIQGTGSDVGKSLITAGLCRAYTNRGLKVRPFKPQNMSNNAAVTIDGGEIGRAQALQARACKTDPIVDMNPILLKPETDIGAQVILRGKRVNTLKARDYMAKRGQYLPDVVASFDRLAKQADLVLVEGAGSVAEINLREGDIANMGFAQAADLPVMLVTDIHRGGAIASIVGTLAVLSPDDAARIKAFLINNFRGDVRLFDEGLAYLKQRTQLICAGVVPFFADAQKLPAEDAVALENAKNDTTGKIHIAVPKFSRIANFDDLDPLRLEPDVRLTLVHAGQALPGDADLILLPGTKSTMADLRYFRDQGWDIDLAGHVRRGGHVLGICGGYQMLGTMIHDPDGIEGEAGSQPGLGLLDVETVLSSDKSLREVTGTHIASGADFTGYEIHLGVTSGNDTSLPFASLADQADGAHSTNGLVAGTYVHGLFVADGFRHAYLKSLGRGIDATISYGPVLEDTLDLLADHMEAHVDLDGLLKLAGAGRSWRTEFEIVTQ